MLDEDCNSSKPCSGEFYILITNICMFSALFYSFFSSYSWIRVRYKAPMFPGGFCLPRPQSQPFKDLLLTLECGLRKPLLWSVPFMSLFLGSHLKGPFLILFGLASGVLPHVPKMLPVLISDPEMRQKVEETFTSQEFMDNRENYFVENIKVTS